MHKEYKIYSLTLLLTLPLLLLCYLGLYLFIYYSSDEFFVEGKVAKSIHMDYVFEHQKIDYVFIGSSKVLNHISTSIFKENNMSIYNYGSPRIRLIDFAYNIKQSIKHKPKFIVLNIDLFDLTQDITKPSFPTHEDYNLINKHFNKDYMFGSLLDALSNHLKLKDILRQMKDYYFNQQEKIDLKTQYYYIENIDCSITNFRGSIQRKVFLCNNGDGMIATKDYPKQQKFETRTIASYNKNKIKMLNLMIDNIKSNNIVPIVVLQPIYFNINFVFDLNILNNQIKAEVINNTNFNTTIDQLWADRDHFNFKGREIYSKHLARQVKQQSDAEAKTSFD